MWELLKKIKTNSLVTAALYAILGVVCLFWPDLSTNLFCTILGLVLVLCGIVDVILFLAHRDGSLFSAARLVVGVILAVVGVYLMSQPTLVAVVIPVVVGILICIHGLGAIGDALTLRRNEDPQWGTALALGLLSLGLGTVLIFRPFASFLIAVRLIGAFLLYDGVSDLWITLRVSRALKQAAQDQQATAQAVDVDFTEAGPAEGTMPDSGSADASPTGGKS